MAVLGAVIWALAVQQADSRLVAERAALTAEAEQTEAEKAEAAELAGQLAGSLDAPGPADSGEEA